MLKTKTEGGEDMGSAGEIMWKEICASGSVAGVGDSLVNWKVFLYGFGKDLSFALHRLNKLVWKLKGMAGPFLSN